MTLQAQGMRLVVMGAFVAAHPSWVAVCVMGAVLFIMLGYRLAAERARRRTLIEVCTYAPRGTVIVQEPIAGSPAMRVWVGYGQPSAAADDCAVLIPVGGAHAACGDGRERA
jgi:hypothetical protein